MTSLEREIKCVVVGDGIVGKTCLLSSFLFNEFPQDTFPETLENCKASVMHKDTPVVLSLFDTQGEIIQDVDFVYLIDVINRPRGL